jgi:hypothetical protein
MVGPARERTFVPHFGTWQWPGSCHFVEQRLCLSEVLWFEAFGEPAVDRRERIARFGVATLVMAEAGEAY